ncbi:hypothetical protein BDI4_1080056 [Burkholderia diffusa]|uniref:hypothetical protein n=1 Tax=Burkholderia diffusa TaxID=488732 RepID=UPI001CB0754D|nr:hypothetical protein [Burkholderia diffusa]CAG9241845.1 hypothetical protein BDI4_1080056 [Burkholderia diffusa]
MAVCRKVLDISYAKDPRLADWLKQSKQHLVVLTEYFAIEALNAGDDHGVAENFVILRNYPDQVLVTKAMNPLCRLAPKQLRKPKNLIDARSTKNFAQLCRQIGRMHTDPRIQSSIQERMHEARLYLENLSSAGDAMKDVLSAWIQTFREGDVKILRRENEWTPEFRHTFLKNIIEQSDMMLQRAHPAACPGTLQDLLLSMNFAFPLCFSIRAVHRSANGDPKDIGSKSHRSDLIDSTYCAVALYFDGLFTHDLGARQTYDQARKLLSHLLKDAPRMPPIKYEKNW